MCYIQWGLLSGPQFLQMMSKKAWEQIDSFSCSRDWLYKQKMAGPYTTIQLWPTNSAAITPEPSRLGQWLPASVFFLLLLPIQDQPEKTKYALNQSNQMSHSCWAHLQLHHANNLQSQYIQNLYHHRAFSLPCLPWILCQIKVTMADSCYSKLWINTLCLFPFGWSLFISTCSKAECWNVIASASEALDLETKKVIYLHNVKANGKWELGKVEIGMSRF